MNDWMESNVDLCDRLTTLHAAALCPLRRETDSMEVFVIWWKDLENNLLSFRILD